MNTENTENHTRILSRDAVQRIVDRVQSFTKGGGETTIAITSWWNGELRWARNHTSLASDRRDIRVFIRRELNGSVGDMLTNQIDSESLRATVHAAERSAGLNPGKRVVEMPIDIQPLSYPQTTIWSDSTYQATTEQRAEIGRSLTKGAELRGMLSAGYLEMRAAEVARFSTDSQDSPQRVVRYDMYTQAQCSMTARHPKGIGSGWAGLSSYDWSSIDGNILAARALDKCLASLNPVAIEPGRYTVIFEPQAVCELVEELHAAIGGRGEPRNDAENNQGPFALGFDSSLQFNRSKLGLKVVDERITIQHDPSDPLLGIVPSPGLTSTTWIEHGILKSIGYSRMYAIHQLREDTPDAVRPSFRMSGGNTTMEEMISSTKRGLIVTRFSNYKMLDPHTLLATGLTRDGLWLVEDGKITKTVKNLRWTESPLFALNQVEQLGIPVPVFHPVRDPYAAYIAPVIVPPIKAKDFSFTAMIDAV